MAPTIISLTLSIIIAAHISKKVRLLTFFFSAIILIPMTSYTLHGLSIVFADMTVHQIVIDSVAVVGYTMSEPIKLARGEVYNPVLLISGCMLFLSLFFGFIQMIHKGKSVS